MTHAMPRTRLLTARFYNRPLPPGLCYPRRSVPLPDIFNAASYFVDRHLAEGRGGKVAIECGEERVTYGQVAEGVNRFANALKHLGVQPEQRCALMLLDSPAFAYSF